VASINDVVVYEIVRDAKLREPHPRKKIEQDEFDKIASPWLEQGYVLEVKVAQARYYGSP
jgi:hypothetical protein